MGHNLLRPLAAIVGEEYVSDDDFVLYSYSRDSSPFPERVPGVVVRPGSTEEVSAVVVLANRTGTPVIPRGGASTVCGIPAGEPGRSIVLDLTRLRDILDVNIENMTVTVQCGAPWSKLYYELGKLGLYTPCVWFPGYTGTVGGSISEAGNPQFHQEYGLFGRHVLSLKVVLPSGDAVQTGSAANAHGTIFSRYTHGPDLTGIFIGDHGIFGVKTEATLRLFPLSKTRYGCFGFPDVEKAFQALHNLSMLQPSPTAHTVMRSAEAMGEKGVDVWNFAYCVIGLDEEELDRKCERVARVCKASGGGSSTKAGERYAEILPRPWDLCSKLTVRGMTCSYDHLMPRDRAFAYFKKIQEWYDSHKQDFADYHIGRYDWYGFVENALIYSPYFAFDDSDPTARKKALDLFHEVLRLAVQSGAIFIFADQDVGDIAASAFPSAYFSLLKALKRAVDPNNIMNPGMFRL